jgi:hypothetical protein
MNFLQVIYRKSTCIQRKNRTQILFSFRLLFEVLLKRKRFESASIVIGSERVPRHFRTDCATVDEYPTFLTRSLNTYGLHFASTLGCSISRSSIVDVQRVQACRAMVAVSAVLQRLYNFSAVEAGEPFLAGDEGHVCLFCFSIVVFCPVLFPIFLYPYGPLPSNVCFYAR